ncbi:histidine kinase dimerization/phospho-acceptor domain-containing protein [Roseofilum capinflatum]|uniref:histidine kinase n=1 Tax=Roseofilum capinflatum BLCC-M114 TaxID=3022440 RepID=A0ABT7B1X3_9CYAN|nr:histidine kinase dimerization/phospho-acceptor domain-containing protein [Roseofilum capinflatum]MDJ1173140.1 histidine kinase dimerization/phospho-acceptor domain-containing protein [Roseofilum capinflatum BLCC-M114]
MLTSEQRILVVYNILSDLETLLALLQESGYPVQTLSYRQGRSTKTLKDPPDLILIDRRGEHPADLAGIESLCRQAVNESIPMLAMTTLEDLMDHYSFYRDHQIDYILYTFEAEELLSRLETHLQVSDQFQDIQPQEEQGHFLSAIADYQPLQLTWIDRLNHEIRTPLHGILGHVQMLYSESDLTPQQHSHLRMIETCSHQVLESMHRILNPTDRENFREGQISDSQPSADAPLDASQVPPSHELMTLYQAAQIGDIEVIEEESWRLKRLNPGYSRFADRILELAQRFEDRAILKLICQCTPLEKRVS